jgi:anaerobic C4-dicarboxylate transporter DcuB
MNMFWVELILVLAIIFLGVRKGGTFLAMVLEC